MELDKSPISILQEYAAAKRIAPPHYHIVSEGDHFKCIVTIENVTQDAKAWNKKRAKHIAAEKLVSLLTNDRTMGSINTTNGPSTESTEAITINSIGELNEFCSRTGIEYPFYEFNSYVPSVSKEFVCKCKLNGYETEGTGKNKKEAKQVAAKRMLDIATSSDNSWKTRTHSTIGDNVPKDHQTIIELFKKLSFKNKVPLNGCTQVVLPKKILSKAEIERLFEEANDEPSLQNLLANLGMKCTIWEFQTNPLVMCIKAESSDYAPFTFIQNGVNKSEITVKLLKDVVDAIAVHI